MGETGLIIVIIVLGIAFLLMITVVLTITLKDMMERKRRQDLRDKIDGGGIGPMPNPYAHPQPTPQPAPDKQGPLVVKIDTTQVNDAINNFLEKLAEELVLEEQQQNQRLGMPQEQYKQVAYKEEPSYVEYKPEVQPEVQQEVQPEPQPEAEEEVEEEKVETTIVEATEEVKAEAAFEEEAVEEVEATEEEKVETTTVETAEEATAEEEAEEEVNLEQELEQSAEIEKQLAAEEKVKILKKQVELYPTPKEIVDYAKKEYSDIEIKYGKDEDNFKILRNGTVVAICQRTNSDYRITFQRKPISAIKLLNKYPNFCVKAASPEGEQWFKLTNKGGIEPHDIYGLIDTSYKYVVDAEAKEKAKAEKAKARELAKKEKAKALAKAKAEKAKAIAKAKVEKEKAKQRALEEKEKAKQKALEEKEAAKKAETPEKKDGEKKDLSELLANKKVAEKPAEERDMKARMEGLNAANQAIYGDSTEEPKE
ncbi:MAG: hypothetical protein IJS58_04355 [Bacilli bacterium]|nr:hypothetical protein [Bacilli bacterium]